MKEILVINPRRKTRRKKTATKKRTTKKSGVSKRRYTKKAVRKKTRSYGGKKIMATKRRKKRTPVKRIAKAVRRRRRAAPRRNPSRARSAARRASGALSSLMTARNVIDSAKQTGGMLAAQFFAKRFADGGGANEATWTWKNYAWGAVGAVGAGLAGELIKSGSGKEFFKGGLSLLMYKIVVNELAQKSEFVAQYFGAGDTEEVFLGTDGNTYTPGETYLGDDGEVYLMGQDGSWSNMGVDSAYLGPETSMGGTLAPPGALGGTLAPPSNLGEDPYVRTFGESDPYGRVFN